MQKIIYSIVFVLFCATMISAQEVGNIDLFEYQKYNNPIKQNYYDWSEKYKTQIEVKLWGAVKNPGVYKVSEGVNLIELLTFAGGLVEKAEIEDIRIIREGETNTGDSSIDLVTIDYSELYEEIEKTSIIMPQLKANDIVIVKQKETTFLEDLRNIYPILSVAVSLISLVIVLRRD